MRGASPIDAKPVVRATRVPERPNESRNDLAPRLKAPRAENCTSPPTSARDWSRTERPTLPANESMATSAATPSAIDDM